MLAVGVVQWEQISRGRCLVLRTWCTRGFTSGTSILVPKDWMLISGWSTGGVLLEPTFCFHFLQEESS